MKLRLAVSIAIAAFGLSACPREQAPPHGVVPAAESAAPATPASLATPASTMPRAQAPELPQSGHARAPLPEPEPATPPPPVDK